MAASSTAKAPPVCRTHADRVRAHASAFGASRGISVLPTSRSSSSLSSALPPSFSGPRVSSIDGLPLRPLRRVSPPRRSRSRSRGAVAASGSSNSPNVDELSVGRAVGWGSLYFVDALAQRTFAECAACGRGLSEENTRRHAAAAVGTSRPYALGFRLARDSGRLRSQARWAHANHACLSRLGLPPLHAEQAARDVIFSPAVGDADARTVLQCLTAACAGSGGASPRQICVERWSFAPAAAWSGFYASGSANDIASDRALTIQSGASVGNAAAASTGSNAAVDRLPRVVLAADDLVQMCQSDAAQPLCVICLEDFLVGDEVLRLPCAHLFHATCASEWLRHKPVCPLDKTVVFV